MAFAGSWHKFICWHGAKNPVRRSGPPPFLAVIEVLEVAVVLAMLLFVLTIGAVAVFLQSELMDRERLFVELFLQFNLLQLNCFDLHHQLLGLLLVLFLPGFLFAIMLFV